MIVLSIHYIWNAFSWDFYPNHAPVGSSGNQTGFSSWFLLMPVLYMWQPTPLLHCNLSYFAKSYVHFFVGHWERVMWICLWTWVWGSPKDRPQIKDLCEGCLFGKWSQVRVWNKGREWRRKADEVCISKWVGAVGDGAQPWCALLRKDSTPSQHGSFQWRGVGTFFHNLPSCCCLRGVPWGLHSPPNFQVGLLKAKQAPGSAKNYSGNWVIN